MFSFDKSPRPAFDPILINGDVMLRSPCVADHQSWVNLREESRSHLTEWEESWPPTALEISAFRLRLRQYKKHVRRGSGMSLFIFKRDDEGLIGGITLSNIRFGAARTASVGYWIGAP
jgi:ribosomal-protein-alanine N-acetyltransferase